MVEPWSPQPTLTFIGYAGAPGSSSYPTYECSGCGVLVTARHAHVDWHTQLAALAEPDERR